MFMNLKVEKWQEFMLGDLFEISLSSGDLKVDECDNGYIPLVSSGQDDNGIVAYISQAGDGKAQIFDKNKITVDMFCNAFYQYQEFYSVSHGRVNILTPKFKMTNLIALFIVTLINKERFKYSYGRAVYSNEITRMVIKLPVTENNEPDWQFMEDYMKSLNYKSITTKNNIKSKLPILESKNWKEYKLGSLFEHIYKAKAHVKNDIENFEHFGSEKIEFITRTDTNNGCDCYVNEKDISGIEKGNAIIIGDTTSTIYYQPITETLNMESAPINSGKFINAEYNLIFHFYTGRDIVQNLKRIADECVILYCIALQKFRKDNTPLEDIGDYINKSDSFKDLDTDIEFLKNLNKLSNACKHSLIPINDKIGKDEPCIYAYETKRDKTGEFLYLLNDFGFSLNYLVGAFNVFYTNFFFFLRQ